MTDKHHGDGDNDFGDDNDNNNRNDDGGHGFDKRLPGVQLGSLNANATDGHGHALFGSGNPATNWEVETNGNFQLGTNVHYRTGDQIAPVDVDHDTLVYDAPAGPQVADPAHGVSSAAPNRNAVSWDYSFSTGNGTGGETIQSFLTHGQMLMQIDTDPGKGTSFLDLHAVYDPALNTAHTNSSGIVWEDKAGHVVINDDQGNAFVTQNSENPAFFASPQPGVLPAPAGRYDIVFTMVDRSAPGEGNGHIVAQQHDVLNLGTPTMTTHA